MRTRSIQPGDIVFCNRSGRPFHAKVIGACAGATLNVVPIERDIRHRRVKASEILDHWTTRREDRAAPGQTTLDLPPAA